ncbi:hypothetical protein V8F33_007424 [Rhypophila sp. PSN 637]
MNLDFLDQGHIDASLLYMQRQALEGCAHSNFLTSSFPSSPQPGFITVILGFNHLCPSQLYIETWHGYHSPGDGLFFNLSLSLSSRASIPSPISAGYYFSGRCVPEFKSILTLLLVCYHSHMPRQPRLLVSSGDGFIIQPVFLPHCPPGLRLPRPSQRATSSRIAPFPDRKHFSLCCWCVALTYTHLSTPDLDASQHPIHYDAPFADLLKNPPYYQS